MTRPDEQGPSYSRAEQILTWTALVAFIALAIAIAFIEFGTLGGLFMAGVLAGATAWLGVTGNLIDHTRTRTQPTRRRRDGPE